MPLVQQNVACLHHLLRLLASYAGERNAIVVAKINYRITVHISGDERLHFSMVCAFVKRSSSIVPCCGKLATYPRMKRCLATIAGR